MSNTLAGRVARGQATKPIKAAAIKYAQRKLRVLGLHSVDDGGCTCKKITCKTPGKHPRYDLSYHGAREPYAPPEVIEQWLEPYNIGISLGDYRSTFGYYLYVLDVDDSDAAQRLLAHGDVLKETACSSSGRGIHIWVASHASVANFNPKRADTGAKLGEFRGDGMYVVVPPSDHVTGRTYAWISTRRVPLMVDDPIDYVARRLEEVGIELSAQRAGSIPVFDGGALTAYELPDVLKSSALKSMRDIRDIVSGAYDGSKDPDRSGKLYWIAQSIKAAAAAHKAPMTVEVLAGIVKRADVVSYRCYTARIDADRQYFAIASKVIADG